MFDYLVYAIGALVLYFFFSFPRIKKSFRYQAILSELEKESKENEHMLSRKISALKQDADIISNDSRHKDQVINDIKKALEKAESACLYYENSLNAMQAENNRLTASVPPEGSVVLSEERQREFFSAYHHFVSKSQEYQSSIDQFSAEKETLEQQINILKNQIAIFEDQKSVPFSMKDYTALNVENNKLRIRVTDLEDELFDLTKSPVHESSKSKLNFLFKNFPSLVDFLASEYDPNPAKVSSVHDPVRDWVSYEEYQSMSEADRNQLALDRYVASHNKSNWQVGRDYELSVGYQYELKGFHVEYTGSIAGVADMGRDLIATKDAKIYIIQCKYWGASSLIREKYIAQLFGTAEYYRKEKQENAFLKIIPLFVTNTKLSSKAKEFADKLGVDYRENIPLVDFPRVKCNVGKNQFGDQTYIYYLPMDPQYDAVKTDNPRECRTFTVQEAESYGFRRTLHKASVHKKKE
ncbi:MAG: restriction endonuclease [Clostridia bacterium]|nr:restriction endonuclease [Clostridia bacterium]